MALNFFLFFKKDFVTLVLLVFKLVFNLFSNKIKRKKLIFPIFKSIFTIL